MRYKEQIILKLFTYTNGSFKQQASIDDYEEISFSHNLYESGDFTITINYNIPNALKFERGMFVQFGNDPYMFGEILTISDSIGDDGKGSQQRTITGKDARYIFKRRVIRNLNNEENWAMTDKGELCLRELVKAQCGAGAEVKRQLPVVNTIPSYADAIGKEYSVAEAYSNLYDTLVTIATQSEIGWKIKFDGSLTLEVYEGNDLSNKVQFSTDYDSLAKGEFTDSAESYANTVYVAGKGTGADRDIYEGEQETGGGSPSGLDRYEAYDNQSSMTSESEYEAEALSMLTQYGQTINVSGQGLAKCPYIFQEQYNIGDTITLAFSGKSAKAQILSVTEHWTWGQYGIEFSFGKPQNDLSRQLQLILKQIQKASNKTTTTSSVKYYTIPTDISMPKADVIYDTIGFQGDVGNNGATFQLYWDSEKTGAKTYHVWLKQLAGTGNLTLTTGVSGKANLVLNSGTYVVIIYVDAEGNVLSQGATPTSTIAIGNTQPATSDGVAQAISSATVSSADKWTNARYFSISDADGTNTGTAVSVDGSENETLKLPSTIKATLSGNASSSTTSDYSRQGAYCTTASGTQAKTASMTGYALQAGESFQITFTNSNSYNGKITLSINGTTAKDVYINGTVSSSSNKTLKAGTYLCYYSGNYYFIDTSNITYGLRCGYCTTGAGITAKVVAMPYSPLLARDIIYVYFTNTNTASNPTLNVNSTGAKPIKVFGTSPNSTNGLLKAGVYYCQYDGTNWNCYPYGVTNTVSADNMQSVTSNAVAKALVPSSTTIIESTSKRSVSLVGGTTNWWGMSGYPPPSVPSGKRLVRTFARCSSNNTGVSICNYGDNNLGILTACDVSGTYDIWFCIEVADL